MEKVECWKPIILTLKTTKEYKNPFLDCIITAEFTGPNNQVIIREAYWDGDNIFRISFAPTEIGIWKYRIYCEGESDINQKTGEIECIPYTGEYAIYQHGFLKISDDHRYFIYADGTPFFWLGDTHWEFAYRENWDKSNHPDMESMFKGMVDRRVEQGYTIYQTNLRSDALMGGDSLYWKEPNIPNVEFYQNELDRRMHYIAENGLVNALGFAWFMSIENQIEKYQNLARYIIARYGALPMVWTLAGETAGYDKSKHTFYIDSWREVALVVQKLDSYQHPRTAHYTNERPFASYYQDEDWFDFTLNQAGHGDFVVSVDDYKAFLKEHNNKPFVEGEAFYEFCSTLEENGTRMCTDDMVRRVAYLTMQAGGCGYTYGAQGIWDNVWEKGEENKMVIFNQYDIPWYEAIDGIGGYQMGYMRKFYEDQKFWELYPYQTNNESIGDPFGKKMPLISVTKDKKHWVFYYPESTRKSGNINGLNNAIYEMQWFNPRTGIYDENINEIQIENKTWKIPMKPDRKDWCLVLKEK